MPKKSNMIDIFAIEEHKVSRDLTGKSFLFYGAAKTGKTTIASKFPAPLLIAFEKGYNMIPGIKAVPINKWTDALAVKKQLLDHAEQVQRGEIPELGYKTVIIDTLDIASIQCEQFIVNNKGFTDIDEPGFGKGWNMVAREIDKFNQELIKAGYTLIIIAHATQRQEHKTGEMVTMPSPPKSVSSMIENLVDVVGYTEIRDEPDGSRKTYLITRGPSNVHASARAGFPNEIPFSYDALMTAMDEVVANIEKEYGTTAVTTEAENLFDTERDVTPLFESLKSIRKSIDLLRENGKGAQAGAIIENYLGKGVDVMNCTEEQSDTVELIMNELSELAAKIKPKKQITEQEFKDMRDKIRSFAEAFNSAKADARYKDIVAKNIGPGKYVSECDISQAGALQQIISELQVQGEALGILI